MNGIKIQNSSVEEKTSIDEGKTSLDEERGSLSSNNSSTGSDHLFDASAVSSKQVKLESETELNDHPNILASVHANTHASGTLVHASGVSGGVDEKKASAHEQKGKLSLERFSFQNDAHAQSQSQPAELVTQKTSENMSTNSNSSPNCLSSQVSVGSAKSFASNQPTSVPMINGNQNQNSYSKPQNFPASTMNRSPPSGNSSFTQGYQLGNMNSLHMNNLDLTNASH